MEYPQGSADETQLSDSELCGIGAAHSTEQQFGREFSEVQWLAAAREIETAVLDRHRVTMAVELQRLRDENEQLRADLKTEKGWSDLWYFVSDEAPMQFEKIVTDWTPSRWIGEAAKLRRELRGT